MHNQCTQSTGPSTSVDLNLNENGYSAAFSTATTSTPRENTRSARSDVVPLLVTNGSNVSSARSSESPLPNVSNRRSSVLLRRKRTTRLIVVTVAFVVLTSLFTTLLYLNWSSTVCTTSKCVLTSSSILQKMDLSIDPCDDFYEFSCGKWINESVNLNYPAWNVLYETTIRVHDRLVDAMLRIANNDLLLDLNRGERAAVQLFRQCTDLDALKKIGLSTWLNFVQAIGGWLEEGASNKISIEDAILQVYNFSVYPLFWSGVEVNYFNSSSHIITIYEQLPLLLMPTIYAHHTPLTADMILAGEGSQATSILQEMGETMAELLNFDIKDDRIRRAIAEMVEFEWRITVAGSQFSSAPTEYEIITLTDLQRVAPAINWRYFLSKLLNSEIDMDEPIAMKAGHRWLMSLSQLLTEYMRTEQGRYIVLNYIKWKAIFFQLAYVKIDHKPGSLWSIVDHYSGPTHLRKEFCLVRTHGIFPLSVPSLLRKLSGEVDARMNRELVSKIARNVKSAYENVLEESDVFDTTTRSVVLQKLRSMTVLSSYPDAVDDIEQMEAESERLSSELFWSIIRGAGIVYQSKLNRLRKPVDASDWIDNKPALSSTPIHNYERNVVQIPMDTIRMPLADIHQIDVANYGSVGSIIGHEIMHAFDEQGHRHGPTGNLARTEDEFWSKFSLANYKEREKCFVEQYSRLSGESTSEEDARKSLSENIADNVGTKVAFDAFVRHGDQSFSKLAALQLSPKQIFFVSYAQGWCALPSKNHQRQVHLAEKIRVLGTLQNSVDFAKAFSCPLGSNMNPQKKCRLF